MVSEVEILNDNAREFRMVQILSTREDYAPFSQMELPF